MSRYAQSVRAIRFLTRLKRVRRGTALYPKRLLLTSSYYSIIDADDATIRALLARVAVHTYPSATVSALAIDQEAFHHLKLRHMILDQYLHTPCQSEPQHTAPERGAQFLVRCVGIYPTTHHEV